MDFIKMLKEEKQKKEMAENIKLIFDEVSKEFLEFQDCVVRKGLEQNKSLSDIKITCDVAQENYNKINAIVDCLENSLFLDYISYQVLQILFDQIIISQNKLNEIFKTT